MGKVKISDKELQDLPYRFGGEIDTMNLLRDKGVPLTGFFAPRFDTDNYFYDTYNDISSSYKVIEWKKK